MELNKVEIEKMIEQLDVMAGKFFAVEDNFLGNQVQEIIYLLEARLED